MTAVLPGRAPGRGAVKQAGGVGDDDVRDWAADEALTELYAAHYRSLVRLSALLLHDVAVAEEVVQDAFVAMHRGWGRLRDEDRALAYLRQAVVNRSRSALRRRRTAEFYAPAPPPAVASAEQSALERLEHDQVVAALRALSPRQREALVLRYYADLPEAEMAELMGLSRGAVKSHLHRGMAALRTALDHST